MLVVDLLLYPQVRETGDLQVNVYNFSLFGSYGHAFSVYRIRARAVIRAKICYTKTGVLIPGSSSLNPKRPRKRHPGSIRILNGTRRKQKTFGVMLKHDGFLRFRYRSIFVNHHVLRSRGGTMIPLRYRSIPSSFLSGNSFEEKPSLNVSHGCVVRTGFKPVLSIGNAFSPFASAW